MEKINWAEVISDIRRTGLTQAQIADRIGVSEGTLSELKAGLIEEPKWSRGDALLALRHERVVRRVF